MWLSVKSPCHGHSENVTFVERLGMPKARKSTSKISVRGACFVARFNFPTTHSHPASFGQFRRGTGDANVFEVAAIFWDAGLRCGVPVVSLRAVAGTESLNIAC